MGAGGRPFACAFGQATGRWPVGIWQKGLSVGFGRRFLYPLPIRSRRRTTMPDLYEIERRYRLAARDLRDAEDRFDRARKRLAADPVNDRDVADYRAARQTAKEKLARYKKAKAGLDRVNDDIAAWDRQADRLRRELRDEVFWTTPTGLTVLCSGEVFVVLLLFVVLLVVKVPVGIAAIVFLLLGMAAVSVTVLAVSSLRRSKEPHKAYLVSEIEAAERGAARFYPEREAADEKARQTLEDWDRADRVFQNHASRVRSLVRYDEAREELETARRRYDLVEADYKEARADWRWRLLGRDWRVLRDTPFEEFVCEVFECLGFRTETTKASGDQGIDVIATKGGVIWGIQCKGYADNVGNAAVQQAYTGRTIYRCDRCMVVTNSGFTRAAQEAARHTGCVLITGADIPALIRGEIRL